jgi:tRNA-dihydrouridine synthase A
MPENAIERSGVERNSGTTNQGRKDFHIAPMIDVSTVEFRYFVRLLTKRAIIWNQMVVAETLVHRSRIRGEIKIRGENDANHDRPTSSTSGGRRDDGAADNDVDDDDDVELTNDLRRHCGWYDGCVDDGARPNPTVCQIGTNDPGDAAFAVRIAMKCGYDSIDLNCECPSDRVAGRCFGAALMKDRDAAVKVVSSMVNEARSLDCHLPVSVKTRIGVDDDDGFDFMANFIQGLVDAGCRNFVLHARKVYTEGLSPAQNRTIPPLDYPRVYRLLEHFPHCSFVINGGIMSLEHARKVAFGGTAQFDERGTKMDDIVTSFCLDTDHAVPCRICNLPHGSCLGPPRVSPPNLSGVMVGRLARDRPADLADIDRYFYGEPSNPCSNRRELLDKYISFLERAYPRRCCDDDETITLGMVQDMHSTIAIERRFCNICQEFRGRNDDDCIVGPNGDAVENRPSKASNVINPQQRQSDRRTRRHAKYKGAKIVTQIIDRALQPTWGILSGESGKNAFRNVSHELSRDNRVRNCGPGFILWKAMQSAPDDVWDRPFELSGEKRTSYYPTK